MGGYISFIARYFHLHSVVVPLVLCFHVHSVIVPRIVETMPVESLEVGGRVSKGFEGHGHKLSSLLLNVYAMARRL